MVAHFDGIEEAALDVLAMKVPVAVSRADVRDALGPRLAAEGMLADDAITDHLQPFLEPPPECVELADRFVARLRVYLEQRSLELL